MSINALLGDILIERRLINPAQLAQALAKQKESKEPLGQIMIQLGFLDESQLRVVLSEQLGVSFLSTDQLRPRLDQRLKECIPTDFALANLVLPLDRSGQVLKVAVAKVPDLIFMDNLRKITGYDIVTVLSTESELKRAIEAYYGNTDLQEVISSSEVNDVTQDYIQGPVEDHKIDLEATISEAEKAPVVKLVDVMIRKALEDRASDIHIEPCQDKINIRYRVDGVLYELPPPPRELHNAMVSRIKILSKMDIAEKRIPQDGSFALQYKGHKVDMRVSTIPIVFGEKVVMRIWTNVWIFWI